MNNLTFMSPWIFYASLSVLGSLIYNVSTKCANNHINPFVFSFVMSISSAVLVGIGLLITKYIFRIDVLENVDSKGLNWGLCAGLGVIMIDVGYFMAVRYGSMVSSQMFWTVGETLVLIFVAALFFKEAITPTKLLGIIFGLLSLFLITKQS